jgi:RNA polymerase sigma-70 factor (ECF subfamily)
MNSTGIAPPRSDESQLARQAQRGDQEAFNALVRLHVRAVYRYVRRLTSDDEAAYDVVQVAFIKTWQAMPRFDAQRPLLPWLLRIADHALKDRWQAEQRRRTEALETLAGEPQDPRGGPFEALAAAELQRAVQEAVAALSPQQRRAFILVKLEEMSSAEAGAQMGLDAGTVRGHVMEALRRIHRFVRERGLLDEE